MSHGVAAGSIGLEGDGPTTLRLQTNKSLEYVKKHKEGAIFFSDLH